VSQRGKCLMSHTCAQPPCAQAPQAHTRATPHTCTSCLNGNTGTRRKTRAHHTLAQAASMATQAPDARHAQHHTLAQAASMATQAPDAKTRAHTRTERAPYPSVRGSGARAPRGWPGRGRHQRLRRAKVLGQGSGAVPVGPRGAGPGARPLNGGQVPGTAAGGRGAPRGPSRTKHGQGPRGGGVVHPRG
jgi:hypothetical protein